MLKRLSSKLMLLESHTLATLFRIMWLAKSIRMVFRKIPQMSLILETVCWLQVFSWQLIKNPYRRKS